MFKFGAKKAWVPQAAEDLFEEIDAEEVQGGVRETSARSKVARPMPSSRGRVKVETASSNVVRLELSELAAEPVIQTGECLLCQGCGAAFSNLAQVRAAAAADNNDNNNNNEAGQEWTCEFCDAANKLLLDEAEYPKSLSVDYLLEPPKAVEAAVSDDSTTILFLVDVSGSMCVSCPAPQNLKLKGVQAVSEDILAFREAGADQRMPGEAQTQYVSRLQCAQAAVEAQIDALLEKNPNTRVGLITFGSDVKIYGDGSDAPITIAGDRLNNIAELTTAGREVKALEAVSKTAANLKKTLYSLQEGGTTALGPSIISGLGMLTGASPGSKMILLTDGLANAGVGAIEDADFEVADAFYQSTAARAKEAGFPISVVAIKGSACKMELLGALAEGSGGDVDIVDPTEITKQFGNVIADQVIATHVSLTFFVHAGMQICDVEHEDELLVKLTRSMGNVVASSTAVFEYRIRPDKAHLAQKKKSLPFQVQIDYRRLDGSRLLRVVTNTQDVTQDRHEAERELDVGVVASNAVHQAAHYASRGSYSKARGKMVAQQKMMMRNDVVHMPSYQMFEEQAMELDDALLDAEANEAEKPAARSASSRKAARSDALAKTIVQSKKYK